MIDIAKEQVRLLPEGDFNITHFDYGVNIMANLLKKFLEDTNFIGVSVSNNIYHYDNHFNDYLNSSTIL